jgi:hypothetical protein
MTKLRLAMVKIVESSLVIIRISSFFNRIQHFRKVIMTESIATVY